ncbi:MAG: hypothetical protein ACK5LX_06020 [Oscillospiraceae bacterium]
MGRKQNSVRNRIISVVVVVILLLVPIAAWAGQDSPDLGDSGAMLNELGYSDEGPDESPNSPESPSLGESSSSQNDVEFILITDQVNTGDLAFTLETNLVARNRDGSRNRSLTVKEAGGFDKDVPGDYEVVYGAISPSTARDNLETFQITVNDPGNFPFDSLPTSKITADSLDAGDTPRWRQRISFDYLPFGWELIQRQDSGSGVYYWTLTETTYDSQPDAPLSDDELEGAEYRWAEAVDAEYLPIGWETAVMQDEITGAQYWTQMRGEGSSIVPFAANDITLSLSSSQQSYQSYTNQVTGEVPPYLMVSVVVNVRKAGLTSGKPANKKSSPK